jgi:hypothetical protein
MKFWSKNDPGKTPRVGENLFFREGSFLLNIKHREITFTAEN